MLLGNTSNLKSVRLVAAQPRAEISKLIGRTFIAVLKKRFIKILKVKRLRESVKRRRAAV